MLVRPPGVDPSGQALRYPSGPSRTRHRELGTRWRRLSTGRQALPALARLRRGHTRSQLAAGFGIGLTTVYRYASEAFGAGVVTLAGA